LPASTLAAAQLIHFIRGVALMSQQQFWLELAKLVVTSFVSLIAASFAVRIAASQRDIARRQAGIAEEAKRVATAKLNLDLFEKRLTIFNATWEQIGLSARGEPYEYKHLGLWFNKIHEVAFLFGTDIEAYFKEIRKRAIDEQQLLGEIKRGGMYVDQAVRDKHKALQEWFLQEAEDIKSHFLPYLSFEEWRAHH